MATAGALIASNNCLLYYKVKFRHCYPDKDNVNAYYVGEFGRSTFPLPCFLLRRYLKYFENTVMAL